MNMISIVLSQYSKSSATCIDQNNLLYCQSSDNTITIYQKFRAIGTFISQ